MTISANLIEDRPHDDDDSFPVSTSTNSSRVSRVLIMEVCISTVVTDLLRDPHVGRRAVPLYGVLAFSP